MYHEHEVITTVLGPELYLSIYRTYVTCRIRGSATGFHALLPGNAPRICFGIFLIVHTLREVVLRPARPEV